MENLYTQVCKQNNTLPLEEVLKTLNQKKNCLNLSFKELVTPK